MLDNINIKSTFCLVERGKKRLNKKISNEEKEFDRLFYWCLNLLEEKLENAPLSQKKYRIIIEESYYSNDSIYLRCGANGEYISCYIKGEQFYQIMKKVSKAFNSMTKNFHSEFVHTKGKRDTVLKIFMRIK